MFPISTSEWDQIKAATLAAQVREALLGREVRSATKVEELVSRANTGII